MNPSPFYFTICQFGAEKALKEEMTRLHPDLRFAFSRPGFVTFKQAEGVTDPSWNPKSVFARAWGISMGKVTDVDSFVQELTHQGATRLRLHVWERDISLPGDEALGYVWNQQAHEVEKRLRKKAPELFLEGPVAQDGDTVLDIILLERGDETKKIDLAWGYHTHTPHHSPYAGGRAPLVLPEEAPSRAWLKLEEMVLWSKAPMRAGELAVEVGSAPGGMTYALLERGLSVIGIDPGQMADSLISHPRFQHIAEPVNAVRRESLPEAIHWVLLDMNVKPDVSLFAVDRLVSRAGPDLLGVLLTVKLNDWKYAREIAQMVKHVEAMGLRDVRVGQLASHRREIAIVGFTRKGLMRLGKRIAQDPVRARSGK